MTLDDGSGFGTGRDNGLDYGWDCNGDTSVNYAGGRRGTNRDGGLGINHFDRNGQCPGPVNWQVAVPNGYYMAEVDFGEVRAATPLYILARFAVLADSLNQKRIAV